MYFYNIFLILYRSGIRIASLWNKKAQLWLNGRKDIFQRLNSELRTNNSPKESIRTKLIWFHCSSLGEFEQGRPVVEKIKTHPALGGSKILITFFSPSGYEISKGYKGADWVFYLPIDSKSNARKFFDIVDPSLVVFVKYDYWYYYLTECKKRKIPLLMISSVFRKSQPFFHWYGSLHRKMLQCFTHFFVQDDNSKLLLETLEINNIAVAGDTRFDRVVAVAENFQSINEIEKFCGNSKVFVAGSTWSKDEKIIKEVLEFFPDLKLIIAPHEIHKEHLKDIKKFFPDSVFFSELRTQNLKLRTSNILIMDNIGMLSKLYSYATITYIGGGFDRGIHNILEAAVYGRPVIFGPKFEKFKEANGLIKAGAGFSINNKDELKKLISSFLLDHKAYLNCCESARTFVYKNKGATEKIIQYIQENRLLIN